MRLASFVVTGADIDLCKAGHGVTHTAAAAECRQKQQQHSKKSPCKPRTHLGIVWRYEVSDDTLPRASSANP